MAGVREARALAEALHREQVDKAGKPYVGHLERVVGQLQAMGEATDDEIAAAWLHDAVEDTAMTLAGLRDHGFSDGAIAIVELVTKAPEYRGAYADRIGALIDTGNRSAMRVKLADIRDNADPSRLAMLDDKQAASLARRYDAAMRRLEAALAE